MNRWKAHRQLFIPLIEIFSLSITDPDLWGEMRAAWLFSQGSTSLHSTFTWKRSNASTIFNYKSQRHLATRWWRPHPSAFPRSYEAQEALDAVKLHLVLEFRGSGQYLFGDLDKEDEDDDDEQVVKDADSSNDSVDDSKSEVTGVEKTWRSAVILWRGRRDVVPDITQQRRVLHCCYNANLINPWTTYQTDSLG